jgi:hypothetical protein
MADYPTFHQMPQGSYPKNAHPIYSLVGKIGGAIVSGILAVNEVLMVTIDKINGVSKTNISKINGVEN